MYMYMYDEHPASCKDGDVRLVNGKNRYEGYIQVCFNQRWEAIYNDGWTGKETWVVCRELGYPPQGTCTCTCIYM